MLGCLCGDSRDAPVRRPRCRCAASSIRSREDALSVLGLDRGSGFSQGELKKAFRKGVLRWHPDAAEGDAVRFQEVRDAYEFLSGTESQDVAQAASNTWEDSGRVRFSTRPGGRTRPDGSGMRARGITPEEEEEQGIRNEYVLLLAGLAALLVAVRLLSPKEPVTTSLIGDRVQMTSQPTNFLLPKALPLRGMEYMLMAQVMATRGGELLLIDRPQADDAALQQGGRENSDRRAAQFVDALLAAFDAAARQRPGYSMTAVVSQDQYNQVLKALRSKETGFDEPRNPYYMFSGRPVARFEREATRQELLVICALDYRRAYADPVDTAFQQKMVNEHRPDLLVLDLSEPAWRSLCKDFGQATGARELGQAGAAEAWPGITQRLSVETS